MSHYFDTFIDKVERARKGDMIWIPLPFRRAYKHLGLTYKMYHLIGGDSGTGKSAYVDHCYVLNPYIWWKRNKDEYKDFNLEIYVRSMERSKEYRIGKWVCWYMYQKHNILMDIKQALGWTKESKGLPDEVYRKVKKAGNWFRKMQDDCVTIIDGSINPTGMWKHMQSIAYQKGTRYRKEETKRGYKIKEAEWDERNSVVDWKTIAEDNVPDNFELEDSHENKYQRYEENKKDMVIYIIDHIAKFDIEQGFSERMNLKKGSEYIANARDRFGFSQVVVDQFNRSLSDTSRRVNLNLRPEPSDFHGASNMFNDSDVCQALFDPHSYELDQDCNYNVQSFIHPQGHNRYRSNYVLKNTYGIKDFNFGMQFIGEIGLFRQLPRPSNMTTEDYTKATTIPEAKKLEDIRKNLEE